MHFQQPYFTIFNYIPLLFYGLIFQIAGICFFNYYPYHPFNIWAIILGACIIAFYYRSFYTIFLLFFCLGVLLAHQQFARTNNLFRSLLGNNTTIRGIIYDIQPASATRAWHTLVIYTDRIKQEKQARHIPAYVTVYITVLPALKIGDMVKIKDCIMKKNKNSSFSSYLAKEHIVATFFIKPSQLAIYPQTTPLFYRLSYMRFALLEQFRNKMSVAAFTFFSSMFLGNRHCNKKETKQLNEMFKQWGMSHYLARSGLHLLVFILLWEYLLRYIPIGLIIKQIVLICIVMGYALLSWSSLSFMRAFGMLILLKLLTILKIPIHSLNLLSLLCIIFLWNNPIQLFFLDFQLSFLLTFAISWYNQIRHIKQRRLNIDY